MQQRGKTLWEFWIICCCFFSIQSAISPYWNCPTSKTGFIKCSVFPGAAVLLAGRQVCLWKSVSSPQPPTCRTLIPLGNAAETPKKTITQSRCSAACPDGGPYPIIWGSTNPRWKVPTTTLKEQRLASPSRCAGCWDSHLSGTGAPSREHPTTWTSADWFVWGALNMRWEHSFSRPETPQRLANQKSRTIHISLGDKWWTFVKLIGGSLLRLI